MLAQAEADDSDEGDDEEGDEDEEDEEDEDEDEAGPIEAVEAWPGFASLAGAGWLPGGRTLKRDATRVFAHSSFSGCPRGKRQRPTRLAHTRWLNFKRCSLGFRNMEISPNCSIDRSRKT